MSGQWGSVGKVGLAPGCRSNEAAFSRAFVVKQIPLAFTQVFPTQHLLLSRHIIPSNRLTQHLATPLLCGLFPGNVEESPQCHTLDACLVFEPFVFSFSLCPLQLGAEQREREEDRKRHDDHQPQRGADGEGSG